MRAALGRAVAVLMAFLALSSAAPAGAMPAGTIIVLPGAKSAEGIAAGRGSTFYAGDFVRGDIFRGDVRQGTAELFIDAPDGRQAAGMVADTAHGLLFVAGAATGQAYVYDTDTGPTIATYQFADPAHSIINDVTLTRRGAWFTDSLQGQLYFVPVSHAGVPGPFETLVLSGPAADTSGQFNLNGIRATQDGRTLIVAHTANGALYTVDPTTGASGAIAGVSVPNVDGIELQGNRLWAVRNFDNQIARVRLRSDLTSGVVQKIITSDAFEIPTTAARFGHRLAVVNAKFDTGVPPTATQFEVIIVNA